MTLCSRYNSTIYYNLKQGFYRVHKNIIIIGDPSETDMLDRRPIGDHNLLHQRPTGLIGDLNMLHPKPTCFIKYPLETDMPDRRTTGDQHA